MAAAAACLLPLLLQLPFPLALALGAVAAAGYWLDRPWPAALRILLVFLVAGYLFVTFGFSIGRDTGTALLAALLAIKPGDRIILYSDGVIEQQSPEGEFFGTDRLLDILNKSDNEVTDVETALAAVKKFAGGAALADDTSVASVVYQP